MFQKSTVLFVITLCALISGLQSVSHSSSSYQGELNIESGPTVTANVSGTYVVKETQYDSGSITRAWHDGGTPPWSPHARSKKTVYGFGTVADKISGKITFPDGFYLPEEKTSSRRIGSWGIRANGTGAYSKARLTFYIYQSRTTGGSTYYIRYYEGTYTRTSDAEVKAYSYNYTTGVGWVKETTPSTAVSEGNSFSWTIDHQYRCPAPYCSEEISAHGEHRITCSHCDEKYWNCWRADADAHQGDNPLCSRNENTVSNNGGTVNNGGSTNSGCANNDTYNWCNDRGSCTTRSGSGVPGECGHNFCCCAPSGSPTYNGNNGGTSGGDDDDDDDDDTDDTDDSTWSSSSQRANGQTWRDWRYRDRTCRRCSTTFNAGNNGTCNSRWGTTYPYHWE